MDFDNMTTNMPAEVTTGVTSGMTTPFVEIQAVPFPMFITRMIQVLAWIGMFGNTFVMIVMLSSKALRSKPINMFMINQSAIDFTASLSIWLRHIYVTMNMTFDNYIWRSIYCKVWLSNLVQIFFFASSGYNLVALSMERYFAIMNPFAYDEEKVRRRLPYVFAFVWFCPWWLHSYQYLLNRIIDRNCIIWANVQNQVQRVLILVDGIVLLSVVPSIIIIFLYVRMAIAIKFGFSSDDKSANPASKRLSKTQKNIFGTCLVMVVASLFSWCYFMLALMAAAVKKGYLTVGLSRVFLMADVILEFNSTINPLIYAVRYDAFQMQVKHLLGWKSFENPDGSTKERTQQTQLSTAK